MGIHSMENPILSPRSAYLSKVLEIYPGCFDGDQKLAMTDKVLLFREMRGYYLDIPFIWGDR